MQWLKTAHIYDLIVSLGQKFRKSFIGWFCPEVFHEVAVKLLAGT